MAPRQLTLLMLIGCPIPLYPHLFYKPSLLDTQFSMGYNLDLDIADSRFYNDQQWLYDN